MTTTKQLSSDDLTHKVSRWQRFLYDEERRNNGGLLTAEAKGVVRNERYPDYQRELFSRLYNPRTPKLPEVERDAAWAEKLHGLAEGMPEFKLLQDRCRGDEVWSGLATSSLSTSVSAKMESMQPKHNLEKMRSRVEGLRDLKEQGVPVDKRLAKAESELAEAEAEAAEMAQGLDPVAIRQAIRQGCDAAQKDLSEAEEQVEAFSFGSAPGTPSMKGNVETKRALADKVKHSPKLRQIAKLAGRLRRVAAEKQRSKTSDARTEISNLEQGAEVDRLLPSELVDLMDPEREALFFARYADRQCLQYKLSGKEKEGRGPIVIAVDESGSMEGDAECWAKAVALALLDIAQRQKRAWAFIHFDSRVSRVDRVKKGERPSSTALADCMAHFTGGGTNFQHPLDKATEIIKQEGDLKKADIILITDGISHCQPEWVARFNAWKKDQGVTLFSVLVNMEGAAAELKAFSDRIYPIADMLTEKDGKFEQEAFSI